MRTSGVLRIFFTAMVALGLTSAGIEENQKDSTGRRNNVPVRSVLKEAAKKVNKAPLFEILSFGSFIGRKCPLSLSKYQ
jgi:hypothetical protein